MPALNWNITFCQHPLEPYELIVDEGLERADIQCADGGRWFGSQFRQDGKQRGFGLAARRSAGNEEMVGLSKMARIA